ncbi:MAG: hypothetical protein IT581_03665 [Verrucomicrobiales bacterium]|nr:hypothetical protein [Verrucomicrobiales bacterium]
MKRDPLASLLSASMGLALMAGGLAFPAMGQVPAKFQLSWTDHPNNPVELKSPGPRAYMPYVLYNAAWPAASRYRVWYDSASIAGLAFSSSADGLTWSSGQPVTGINTAAASSTGLEFAGRPVVVFNAAWDKPFRIYYYGRTESAQHKIWVAESNDGIAFENNRVALDPEAEGSRLATFPDGHAVIHLPGRKANPDDPDAARPFVMYFQSKDGQGIAYAESKDGYTFEEPTDNPDTEEVEGFVRITGLPDDVTAYPAQPVQVLALAQNDFRMIAFSANTSLKYLISADGFTWRVAEDPIAGVGAVGPEGTWNDQRNYHGSLAYVGAGRFFLMRSGRDNGTGTYRTGAAWAESAFYRDNDLGRWAVYSPFDNYQAEGWAPSADSSNQVDGNETAVLQNTNGTVSVRDRKAGGNFYLAHDTSWSVPFTFEFRSKYDDAQTTGTGTDELPKYTFSVYMQDDFHPGPESWQPAFAANRFGRWTLADESAPGSYYDVDGTQFHTYTVVCRFDETARSQLVEGDTANNAASRLAVFDIYLDRDFSAPKASYFSTSFAGFPGVDVDGRLDIGFPGPSSGQLTVDWVRWGNGIILDPTNPGTTTAPTLAIQRDPGGVKLTYSGGTLESADAITGPYSAVAGATSGSVVPTSAFRQFYRVRQ